MLMLGVAFILSVRGQPLETAPPPETGKVQVLGQVMRAGPTPLFARDCLLIVIARAGGFTPAAKSNAVEVVRKKSDGNKQRIIVDCNSKPADTPEGSYCGTFVPLPDDIIFVPEAPR